MCKICHSISRDLHISNPAEKSNGCDDCKDCPSATCASCKIMYLPVTPPAGALLFRLGADHVLQECLSKRSHVPGQSLQWLGHTCCNRAVRAYCWSRIMKRASKFNQRPESGITSSISNKYDHRLYHLMFRASSGKHQVNDWAVSLISSQDLYKWSPQRCVRGNISSNH
jgi:hypothetical protein